MTPAETIEAANSMLEDFEESKALPKIEKPRDQDYLEKLINSSREERAKMSPSDCDDAAISLASYSVYVNRVTQAEEASAKIAASNVAREIAEPLKDVRAYNWEERKLVAIGASFKATAFHKLQIQHETRVVRLKDLSKLLNELARYFGASAYGKRKHYD